MIGIVGGVGPLAGIDVLKKILEETNASSILEQLPILLSTQPHRIGDCLSFLENPQSKNPATAIAEIINELHQAGATVFGIPSIFAHSPKIFDTINQNLPKGKNIQVLNLVNECADYINDLFKDQKIGLLTSSKTRSTGLYTSILTRNNIEIIEPSEHAQEEIDNALHEKTYGVKIHHSPITNRAHDIIVKSTHELRNQGSQAILVTEPEFIKALRENELFGVPILDPIRILARALIKKTAPEKLN